MGLSAWGLECRVWAELGGSGTLEVNQDCAPKKAGIAGVVRGLLNLWVYLLSPPRPFKMGASRHRVSV